MTEIVQWLAFGAIMIAVFVMLAWQFVTGLLRDHTLDAPLDRQDIAWNSFHRDHVEARRNRSA